MRAVLLLLGLTMFGVSAAANADALAEARRLYNLGQYETAAQYAREAMKTPATMESARLVLGRVHLEQFRRSADAADLAQAREALKSVNAGLLDPQERAELVIGLAESLFLEERFGTASEVFERAIERSRELGPAAHERVLDWWASSIDRQALSKPRSERLGLYFRIVNRMEGELAVNPASAAASYWLAAGLRGAGELERAWHAAIAGWVTGALAYDHGAALRGDLDRLMTQGIIPDRAAQLQPRDPKAATTAMMTEWQSLKAAWSR